MTKMISLIQVKGGAGRSVIATNLAGLIEVNKKIALIDCDMPQASVSSWASNNIIKHNIIGSRASMLRVAIIEAALE